jgi:putative aminopeptidase FrvX
LLILKRGEAVNLNNLLTQLSAYNAVSGFENGLTQYIAGLFRSFCHDTNVDKFYNVTGLMKGCGDKGLKILITAHYDEIGMLVKSINEKGFIKFTNIGGIDARVLLAQEVIIHGKKDVFGVIGAKPPHLLSVEELSKGIKMKDLSIDTGLGPSKVKELISIGDTITFKTYPFNLNGEKLSSKSMDNRSGIAAMVEIMKELSARKLVHDVYFTATVQEELRLTGAITAAYNIKPDLAIVIDVCHGDMPDTSKQETYPLGKGPAIGLGPILDRNISRKLIDIAKDRNIPYQIDVEPRDTGTEAWAVQVSRSGVRTGLISIPVRYMHTPVETVCMDDIRNAARLTAEFVCRYETEGRTCF